MFQCLPGLYIAVFDKYREETKYDPLTRFALMALARKKCFERYFIALEEARIHSLYFMESLRHELNANRKVGGRSSSLLTFPYQSFSPFPINVALPNFLVFLLS